MTERDLDELGPVDFLVIEFPKDQANFTGEMADGARRSSWMPARYG